MAEGAADEAFGRAAELVQRGVRELAVHFGELLAAGPRAAAAVPVPVGLLGGEAARADLAVVRVSGEGALLEEVALDLLEESIRQHVIPHFWRQVPLPRSAEAGATERFCAAWAGQLQGGVSALRVLHSAHVELLRGLGTPGIEQLARRYSVVFRIAFSETLPASFAEQAHRYFRWTWQRCSPHRRGRRHEPSAEEWWWAPLKGEAAAPALAARVIALLNPARRPPVALNGVGSTAMDGSLEQDCGFDEAGDLSPGWPGGSDEGMLSFVPEEDDEDEDDAQAQVPACSDASAEGLRFTSEALQCMGLGEVWRDLVMRFVVEELGATVEERCRSEYDSKGLLDQLTAWLYSPLLRWLRTAYGLPSVAGRQLPVGDAAALEAEAAWWVAARRVVLQFFETFVEVRIREAFDMVRDFPDSMPALLDLRRCLARTGRTAPLVRALRQQLTRRLLIAGAHTRDVIKVYIKTIKAMRLVDPRGLLLEAVSAPIRSYLKRRKDTIRCIITALTEDSDLQLELHLGAESTRGRPGAARAGPGAPGDGATGDAAAAGGGAGAAARPSAQAAPAEPPDFAFGGADFDVSEDEEDPDAWTPDPIDADPLLPSRQRRAQDVISLLVGIYGSKEMFIKEYKEMLADRLLGNPSYSTEREMQNLELLKTRFGEAALAHCEVMLQDIKDSKRINGNVQQLAKAKQAPATRQSAVLPFRPPSRAAAEAGAGQRGFAAPFSLGSMFGLCLSPPGTAGAAEAASSVVAAGATGAAGAAGAVLQPQDGAPACGCTAARAEEEAAPAVQAEDGPAAGEDGQGLSLEQMHALVLSQHYWPSALSKADHPNFKLPASLEEALTDYSAVYGKVRARRSLHWKRVHGLVEMTVQLADRAIPVVVSPVHYAVLACFTDRASSSEGASQESTPGAASASPRLSLQEVAAHVELPEALVRKRLSFWVAKGVLREVSAGVFDVQESLSTMESTGGNHLDEDVEHSPGQSAVRPGGGGGRDSAAELKVCEAFVQVVLTNSAAQPLGRIHNYLQMFMTDPQYTQTETQLRDFLSQLCQEGKLEFNGSNYSLVKKT